MLDGIFPTQESGGIHKRIPLDSFVALAVLLLMHYMRIVFCARQTFFRGYTSFPSLTLFDRIVITKVSLATAVLSIKL